MSINLRAALRKRRTQRNSSPVQVVSRFRKPNFVHHRLDVVIPTLPDAFDGYRMIQLTDLHFGPAIAYRTVMAGIERTMALDPDLIVLTGDYVTSQVCDTLLPAALRQLSAPDGVWAVMGNHDHSTDVESLRGILTASGVKELANRSTPITRSDASIWLAGVDSIYARKQDLNAALADIPNGAATILLAHEPDFADEAAASGRVSLQLSGHAHGGSIRIPVLNKQVMSRLVKHGRKYPYGLYRPGGMWLYTSAGIGRGRLPRFNGQPEITEITLWQSPVMQTEAVRLTPPLAIPDLTPELAIP